MNLEVLASDMFGGLYAIVLGLAAIKIHFDKAKESVWGKIYRNWEKRMKWEEKGLNPKYFFLYMGGLSIIAGISIILFS